MLPVTSPEYEAAIYAAVVAQCDAFNVAPPPRHLRHLPAVTSTQAGAQAASLGDAVDRANALYELAYTIRSYINAFVSTDSRDGISRRRESEFEQVTVRMRTLYNRFQAWVGRLAPELDTLLSLGPAHPGACLCPAAKWPSSRTI